SVAILEALACRTPAVVSEACHFPEVAAAGAGAVVPLDPGRVAAALVTVLADPAARIRAGEAVRPLVAVAFTWPAVAAPRRDAHPPTGRRRPLGRLADEHRRGPRGLDAPPGRRQAIPGPDRRPGQDAGAGRRRPRAVRDRRAQIGYRGQRGGGARRVLGRVPR